MFNFIDNYSSWVTDDLLNFLESHEGDTVPVWQPDRWSGHPLLEDFKEQAKVFETSTPYFQQFNTKSKDMQDKNIVLPVLPEKRNHCHWWFIKLLPGQMQTMHIDPHLLDVKNPVRYTMFLQDFHPGHIFVYEDNLASGYKKGDLYEWSDPMIIHGCVNISYQTRYTLQVTLYD